MTGMSIQHADMERYAGRVRAALADLPTAVVTELTEDLENHLSDVIAETTEPLEGRLGPPEDYAAELRRAGGLPPAAVSPPAADSPQPLSKLPELARTGTVEATEWLSQFAAWNQFRAFLPELRPGWWVLRGVLVAFLLLAIVDIHHAFLLLVLGGLLAWASVAIGRRTPAHGTGWRWIAGVNAAIAFAGLVLAIDALDRWPPPYPAPPPAHDSPGSGLTNLYIYDKDGKPLREVQAFDQYNNPVDLGGRPPPWYRPDGTPVGNNIYPRPARPESGEPQPMPTAGPVTPFPPDPAASPSAPPSAEPSPGATPPAGRTATPAPRVSPTPAAR
jgi:hypothetical protein